MLALARLAQQEGGAAANDVHAMIDEVADGLIQPEFLGLVVDHGKKDHGEAFLHLRVLVELVENDLRFGGALEFDDDAHAVAIALVANVGDVVDDFFVHQVGDALDELRLVDLVGDLGDDDRLLVLGKSFDGGAGTHEEAAAACFVGLGNAAATVEKSSGGEVGALHVLENGLESGVGIVDQLDGGVDDFREIVWRNVGRHADGDSV